MCTTGKLSEVTDAASPSCLISGAAIISIAMRALRQIAVRRTVRTVFNLVEPGAMADRAFVPAMYVVRRPFFRGNRAVKINFLTGLIFHLELGK